MIFHAGRNLIERFTLDKPVRLEVSKDVCKGLGADPAQTLC